MFPEWNCEDYRDKRKQKTKKKKKKKQQQKNKQKKKTHKKRSVVLPSTHCRLNELTHTIYWKILLSI